MIIIDEAHKCRIYTKRSSTRGGEAEKTKRYHLAERLTANPDHVLLLTAIPHHGDDDRFAHFIRLIDPARFQRTVRAKTPVRFAAKYFGSDLFARGRCDA